MIAKSFHFPQGVTLFSCFSFVETQFMHLEKYFETPWNGSVPLFALSRLNSSKGNKAFSYLLVKDFIIFYIELARISLPYIGSKFSTKMWQSFSQTSDIVLHFLLLK